MKEIFKQFRDDSRWQPVLMVLGNLVVLGFIIFPGLTVANTFINMICLFIFIALFLFDLNYVKFTYFTKSEEEKQFQSEWNEKKEEMEEKLKNQKDK